MNRPSSASNDYYIVTGDQAREFVDHVAKHGGCWGKHTPAFVDVVRGATQFHGFVYKPMESTSDGGDKISVSQCNSLVRALHAWQKKQTTTLGRRSPINLHAECEMQALFGRLQKDRRAANRL